MELPRDGVLSVRGSASSVDATVVAVVSIDSGLDDAGDAKDVVAERGGEELLAGRLTCANVAVRGDGLFPTGWLLKAVHAATGGNEWR